MHIPTFHLFSHVSGHRPYIDCFSALHKQIVILVQKVGKGKHYVYLYLL